MGSIANILPLLVGNIFKLVNDDQECQYFLGRLYMYKILTIEHYNPLNYKLPEV